MTSLARADRMSDAAGRSPRPQPSAAILPFARRVTVESRARPALSWVLDPATGALRQRWAATDQPRG